MGHKSKKHTKLKLEETWLRFVMNMTIGVQLEMLATRNPEYAQAISEMCVVAGKNLFVEGEFENKEPIEFLQQYVTCILEIMNNQLTTTFIHFLENGMPKVIPK